MNMRSLVVDDEPLARQRVLDLLEGDRRFEVVGQCGNGPEAVEAIERLAPDLVFLDVQMPGLDGFGVIEALDPEALPLILFVTAYDRYAVRAFEARAVDFLLKPFDDARFQKALSRVLEWRERDRLRELRGQIQELMAWVARERPHPDRFLARLQDRQILVRARDIQWVEAEDNYVRLHTAAGSSLLRQTLDHFLSRLDPRNFRRIHRSAIVNLDCVKEIQPWFSGDALVFLKDGTRLTLSRTYRGQLADPEA